MPIKLEPSGFYEWQEPLNPVPSLGIHTAKLEEFIQYYHEKSFRGLFGHPSFGFDQDDLDFLAQTPDAIFLWMWDVKLRQIDALYELTELEHMGIHPKRPGIDFSRFPALHTVVNHWFKADHGIAESTITKYHLWHYKPKTKSFEGLEIPHGVEILELNWVNPASLAGLPVMNNLRELHIHRSRNLTDLSVLPEIAPNLQRLLATSSSRIDPTAGVQDHPTLKYVYVNQTAIETGSV